METRKGGSRGRYIQRVLCITTRERQVEKCATQKKATSANTFRKLGSHNFTMWISQFVVNNALNIIM